MFSRQRPPPVKPAEKLPTSKPQAKKKAGSKSTTRTPEELLDFIIFNISPDNTFQPLRPVSIVQFGSVEELQTRAKSVCDELCALNKQQSLKNFELGFICHQAKKRHNNYSQFIRELVNAYDVLGLSHSYTLKLIRFYKVFRNYRKLLSTTVNFTTLLNNLTTIQCELNTGKYTDHYNELDENEEQDDVEEEFVDAE